MKDKDFFRSLKLLNEEENKLKSKVKVIHKRKKRLIF